MREFTITEQVYRMSKLITHDQCDQSTEMYRGMFMMRLLDYAFDGGLPEDADWSDIIEFIVDGEVSERTENAHETHSNAPTERIANTGIKEDNALECTKNAPTECENAPFLPSAPSSSSPSSSSPITPTTPTPISPSSPSNNPDEKTTQKAAHESSLRAEFDLFWKLIQNKKDVQRAFKAWKAMRKRKDTELTPQQLTELYNQHYNDAREPQFAKRPATWLNAASYLDEPDTQQPAEIQVTLAEPVGWKEVKLRYPEDTQQRIGDTWEDVPEELKGYLIEDCNNA
jgi:hypothetical protein